MQDSSGSGGGGGGGSGSDGGSGGGPCASAGDRVCIDATHSGFCDGSLQPQTDRDCPTGSMCSGGYCQPPANATPCALASGCSSGKVCDLYVVGGGLTGFCTDPVGNQGTYQSCNAAGDDATCKSGLCVVENSGEARRECFVPCIAGMDSTCPGDKTCSLIAQPTMVEGASMQGHYGCFD